MNKRPIKTVKGEGYEKEKETSIVASINNYENKFWPVKINKRETCEKKEN